MLRITSGIAKGKKLNTPNIDGYRAIQDKAKLAIFSIISDKVLDAKCLDLFAGSGNLGIEALSRGAKYCDFVDEHYEAEKTIRLNLANAHFEDCAEVYRQDCIKFVANGIEKYDLVFVDPFFKDTHFRYLFENLQHLMNVNGLIIFSHGKNTDVSDSLVNSDKLKIIDTRRYGNAHITFIKFS